MVKKAIQKKTKPLSAQTTSVKKVQYGSYGGVYGGGKTEANPTSGAYVVKTEKPQIINLDEKKDDVIRVDDIKLEGAPVPPAIGIPPPTLPPIIIPPTTSAAPNMPMPPINTAVPPPGVPPGKILLFLSSREICCNF